MTERKRKPRKTTARERAAVRIEGDLTRAKRYLQAVSELARPLNPLTTETELLARFEAAVALLFPGVPWVLRGFDSSTGKFALRGARGVTPKATVRTGDTAGTEAVRVGRVTRTAHDRRSEVDPGGFTAVVPLIVGITLLGYFEIAIPRGDDEALSVVELIVGQLAVALRTLQSGDESRNLERYLASVVEHANSILIITSREGRIRFFNRHAEELSGYQRAEVVGRNLLRVFKFHKGDRELVRSVLSDAFSGKPVTNFEARYVTKSEETRMALFNTAPLHDAKGQLAGVIITGLDLTERRDLERQVIHTEKLASLGEMAAGIAHELNNPLTSIYTQAELLLRTLKGAEGDPAAVRRLESVLEGAERIRTLTRNLMGYARPSAQELGAHDLNRLVEQALGFCHHEVTRHGATLRRELVEPLPFVRGSASEIQQVIVNLVTNASHATAGRNGLVTVRTFLSEAGVGFEVEDNGQGIAPEHLQAIFTPFFTTKGEEQGTGLGLSIVMRILERHDARVSVRSKPGEGACFVVTFPAA